MSLRAVSFLLLAVLWTSACGDEPTGSPSVRSIEISGIDSTIAIGQVVELSAVTRDFRGNELQGRPIEWSSTRPAIAKVTASGVLTARTLGTTMIMAASERRADTLHLRVVVPVTGLFIWAPSTLMAIGQSQQMSIVVRNAQNEVVDDYEVEWTSSNPSVATVDALGNVTAHATGTAQITATVGQQQASANVEVIPAPTIGSVTPAQLVPGQVVTINGTNFHTDVTEAGVTFGGVPAVVQSVSPTSMTAVVPCTRSGASEVRAWREGAYGPAASVSITSPQAALAVGESVVRSTRASSECVELGATANDATYLVMPFSVGNSAGTFSTTQVYGITGANNVVAARRVPAAALRSIGVHARFGVDATRHLAHLEREASRFATLRSRAEVPSAASAFAVQAVEVGDTRGFFYTLDGGCADVSKIINAAALHVGARSVLWEDQANTLRAADNAQLADAYARLAEIYETDQHDIVAAYFANPLLRDGKTDGDGKVHLVFSERLNGSGVDAFTTVCDQFARAGTTPASNVGEVIYASVPTLPGSNFDDARYVDGWLYLIARTIVHEMKHVASFSARLESGAPDWESTWLEEATARAAEELWVRAAVHKVAERDNSGWGSAATNGVYCDFHPSDATCNSSDMLRRPSYGMRRHFNEILPKLLDPWNFSPYGDPADQQGVFYNTAWSLVRYAADRFGSSDAQFFNALTSGTKSGLANLLDMVGVSQEELLGGWGLALYTDDYPGLSTSNKALQFASWNLRSVYEGLHASPEWSGRFSSQYPIQPTRIGAGPFFADAVHLRGASHIYYEVDAPQGATAVIGLRSFSGADADIRIAIVRLK